MTNNSDISSVDRMRFINDKQQIQPKPDWSFFHTSELLAHALLASNAVEVLTNVRLTSQIKEYELRILKDAESLMEGLIKAEGFLTSSETNFMLQPDSVAIVNAIREIGWDDVAESIALTKEILNQLFKSSSENTVNIAEESINSIIRFLRIIRQGIEHLVYETENREVSNFD